MDACAYAPALLLLQLMHSFMSEKHAQRRAAALLGADASICGTSNSSVEAESFFFRANDLKFRSPEEALDAAVAYLARPSLPRAIHPPVRPNRCSIPGDAAAFPVLLVIMGADSLPLVEHAASAFTTSWHAAGCRRIIITGGIGRATPDLIKSFRKRNVGSNLELSDNVQLSLPFAHSLGGPQTLPFLHDYSSFSVSWPPAVVAQYVTEADIFAEVVLEALQAAGITARYSRASFEDQGNLQLQPELPWHSAVEEDNSVSIWVEPGSTHTGTNVDHTIALLSAAASPPLEAILSSTIIVQHPALLARSAATFHKKAGVSPMRWTSTHHYEDRSSCWSAAKGLNMALAEYQRFPAYANELGFVIAPHDLPWEMCEFANLCEVKSANAQLAVELQAEMEAALI